MTKQCKICGQMFETKLYGNSRRFCFNCVPDNISICERTIIKRQSIRKQGIKLLGDRCMKCGEERIYLLDFHHRDQQDKESSLSTLLKNSQNVMFFNELKKCILLCANCHREFHYLQNNQNITTEEYVDLSLFNPKFPSFERTYTTRNKTYTCKECHQQFTLKQGQSITQICPKCAMYKTRKVSRPNSVQLYQELIQNSFTKLGKKYKVTDNTIRKWCKAYGLPTHSSYYRQERKKMEAPEGLKPSTIALTAQRSIN